METKHSKSVYASLARIGIRSSENDWTFCCYRTIGYRGGQPVSVGEAIEDFESVNSALVEALERVLAWSETGCEISKSTLEKCKSALQSAKGES